VAAREADGWNGWALDVPTFERRVALLRREARARAVEPTWGGAVVVGRDGAEAELLVTARRARGIAGDAFSGSAEEAAGWLARLSAAGAAWAIVLPAGGPDRIELIGERVLPVLAARTLA
jgi:alkanesulfonate monooxygenase SsuD/methylene tetrahydromethanopterin reductase-like flavin-dependent oxidoreductase (luciferase family)